MVTDQRYGVDSIVILDFWRVMKMPHSPTANISSVMKALAHLYHFMRLIHPRNSSEKIGSVSVKHVLLLYHPSTQASFGSTFSKGSVGSGAVGIIFLIIRAGLPAAT